MRRAPNVEPVPQSSGVLGPRGAAALSKEEVLATRLGAPRTFWRASSPQADPRTGTTISLSLRSARGRRAWSANPSTLGDWGG
ncbi:hypothetical protein BO83DRAFT_411886 [Aspergillus eucalypticola CBS 122712]|uniref:Uncharacterized protein n=1 Tax=Aspergillus eucalypticola (strain CBS 122712 / IBT 29274) TaxID=1448314 RepID=A0A317UQU8_ASPEC|nr:uncharacterized protein BO83DRAFT_411886 [Aspergillus eucalypticola CBS 122712]PWY63458.1 hypothetical protein BO83DRAFT_411886 [Aspergillus eucalypticola CBS 122712]